MSFDSQFLKDTQLEDAKTFQALHDELVEFIQFNDVDNILLFRRFFAEWFLVHSNFKVDYPDQAKIIQELLYEANWVVVSSLKPEEIIDLFQHHINPLFAIDQHSDLEHYPIAKEILNTKLRIFISGLLELEDKDGFKQKLIQAIETNQEVMTSAKFFAEIKEVQPTLQNWMSQYIEFAGLRHSQFSINRFFREHSNCQALSADEKDKLKLLITCYERLRVSSGSILGFELPIPLYDPNVPFGVAGTIDYGEEHRYNKDQAEKFRNSMKNYLTVLEESNQPVPDYVRNIVDGVETHPPIAAVTSKLDPNFVVTGPDVDATQGPDHFADQDLAEIERYSTAPSTAANKTTADYQQVANDIKSEVALSFNSPEDDKRFVDLVVSVLRGLRDTIELKQYLLALAFPSAECEAVVATVQQHLAGSQPIKRQSKAATQQLASKPTLQQLQKRMIPAIATSIPVLAANVPANVQVEPPRLATAAPTHKAFLPKLRRSRAVKRPLVDDVRLQPSMVMGPIDELRAMDMLEFRRLSPDSMLAANRLKDKIELLAEESITKQAEGIDAFKQSPLNTLYLELGNDSIASGKPVTAVIAERQAIGTPTLSEIEFNAISDLNKQIRF